MLRIAAPQSSQPRSVAALERTAAQPRLPPAVALDAFVDAPARSLPPPGALQSSLDTTRAENHALALSAGMLAADGTMWVGASGKTAIGGGRDALPTDLFPIGSITKTFTAAL